MVKQTRNPFYTEEEKDLLIRFSSDMLVVSGFDGYFKGVNSSFTKILGWTTEEFLAKPFIDFVHPDDRAATFREMEAFKTGTEVIGFENRYLCKDGTYRWICWNGHPVVDKGVIVGIGRDITERKLAEKKLQDSEAMLTRAQEMAHVGHWELDLLSQEAGWSDEMYRIFGLIPQECEIRVGFVLDFVHPDDRARIEKALQDASEGVRPYDETYRIVRPDGTIRWVHSKGELTRTEEGTPHRFFGTILDITERKQMEEELRQSRDELERRVKERTAQLQRSEEITRQQLSEIEAYYNMAPVGLGMLDQQLRILRINEKMADLNDVPFDAHIGRPARDVLPKKVADWFEGVARHLLETGRPMADLEISSDTPAAPGIEKTARVSCFPLKDPDGQAVGIGVIAEEITEKKRLEEQLRQSQKMEAIGTLAGGIAHDFNNMLAIIMGNAELALDDVHEAATRRNLEAILGASKRSRDLVRQILTFSRKSGVEEQMIDMASLLKETQGLLRSSLPATIRIILNIRTAPGTTVMADPSRIQQVILNLASNAAYAMRKKGGTLTLGLSTVNLGSGSARDESGPYVKLTVKDTGTGIPVEIRRRMFEPFFTTKEPGQGTGMGLSVVYGIVKDFNGVIEVESEVGKSTTFTVLFPQGQDTAADQQEHEASEAPGKERILLVDDEVGFAEMAVPLIERLGYRVTSATDSVVAMGIFSASPDAFDLIITDQTMPDMTGIELARKALTLRKDIPIILCTGYSELVSPEIAKEAGIREFVMKPIRKLEMVRAIRKALEQRENPKHSLSSGS